MILTDVLLTTTLPHDKYTNDLHNLTKSKRKESDYFDKNKANKENESDDNNKSESYSKIDKRELDDAVDYGIRAMQELIEVKEPKWYKMGKLLLCDGTIDILYYLHMKISLSTIQTRKNFN